MAVKPIPDGYHSVTPYIIVQGAALLIAFLAQAFQAKEIERMMRPDGTIMHAEVRIGDSVIMISDAGGEFEPMPSMIHLYVNNTDTAYKRALQASATSLREPADQFYGDHSAGVKDSCGNQWWIATHQEDVSPEELVKRAEAFMKQQR